MTLRLKQYIKPAMAIGDCCVEYLLASLFAKPKCYVSIHYWNAYFYIFQFLTQVLHTKQRNSSITESTLVNRRIHFPFVSHSKITFRFNVLH